jgi:NAD(P)-dependent dehydrogenase (short-subunit alcohol dehydrogenase family)
LSGVAEGYHVGTKRITEDADMPEHDSSMAGKVCLVTGATAGIGAETAEALARRGATVCLVGRSAERLAATARRIQEQTGNPTVVPFRADLSAQADIRRLADEFRARCERLDVLVNNAGAMFLTRQESVDGIEMTWALNHLAYFLLTNLLLDRLEAAAPSRVICVASDAHHWPSYIDFDDLQWRRRRYRGMWAYAESKLANVLFTFELARRLKGAGKGVTANALHPGFVASRFFTSSGMTGVMGGLMRASAGLLAISPERGAATSIYLASAPDLGDVSGQYFEKQKPVRASEAARDEAAARRLWESSEEMTRLPASPPARASGESTQD